MIDRLLLAAVSVLVYAVSAPAAHAEWPERPIRWIVPFGSGGANDLIARVAGEAVGKGLGQPIIIENRPGAGAVIGTTAVAKSAGDGYTFLIGASGVVTNSLLLKSIPYADSELVPVGMIAVAPPQVVEKLSRSGIEPAGGSVAEFAAFIASERKRLGDIAAKAKMSEQ